VQLRGDDLEWRPADGEILVLDRRRGRYLTVTGAGAVLWPLLAEPTTRAALVAGLIDHYGITEARASADVTRFVDWLEDAGLLAP
jgi:hypothetical protein